MNSKPTWRTTATKEYRFFLYDRECEGTMFFADKGERDTAAAQSIKNCLDEEGWSEEVEYICCGEVTHISTCKNKEQRPEVTEDMEQDEIDEIGMEWGDHEWRGNFEMMPVGEAKS